ncbi:MAG: HAMP domain-containing sensor histidine kinase [Microbacteriaceae bacterium]
MHESLQEHWNSISLRTKITSVTVLVLTLGLLVSGAGTMAMLKPILLQQLDNQLQSAVEGNLNTYLSSGNNSDSKIATNGGVSDYFVAVFDSDGTLVARNWMKKSSEDLPILPNNFDLLKGVSYSAHPFDLASHDHRTEFRAVSYTVELNDPVHPSGTALVAASTDQIETIMGWYLAIFLGFGVLVVIVGALLTRLLVASTFGPLREVEDTAASIADGDFSQRLGGATPNTEVGRLNRSLNTMLNRIDRAFRDRAKTIDQMRRFVGDASHELRTPLVSVRGYAELYRMGALQSPEDIAQAMDRIEKEAIRMGVLVEDLLELARLDEIKPMALIPVDLVPIARDAALDAMASAPDRVVTVLTPDPIPATTPEPDTSPDSPTPPTRPLPANGAPTGPIAFAGATLARLRNRRLRKPGAEAGPASAPALPAPPPVDPAIVLAEENKIRQVVTNLMGNAARFTAPDSPLEILVQVNHQTNQAILEIIDHGEGIPPQIREKIFQRFWRADTSRTRETGGSGLGLAIVSSIVAAHNGTVEVVETPGGGATFRIALPLASASDAAQNAPAPNPIGS